MNAGAVGAVPIINTELKKDISLDDTGSMSKELQAIVDKTGIPYIELKRNYDNGLKVEQEHKDVFDTVKKHVPDMSPNLFYGMIVLDHLREDPAYYKSLAKMEKDMESKSPDADNKIPFAEGFCPKGRLSAEEERTARNMGYADVPCAAFADKCPESGCVKKQGDSWRVISNKTGKLWPAHYKTEKDAKAALAAYHVAK